MIFQQNHGAPTNKCRSRSGGARGANDAPTSKHVVADLHFTQG
jgi:hypothetical protein